MMPKGASQKKNFFLKTDSNPCQPCNPLNPSSKKDCGTVPEGQEGREGKAGGGAGGGVETGKILIFRLLVKYANKVSIFSFYQAGK